MAALRCPHCDVALTEAEAAAGACSDCSGPVGAELPPLAEPVVPTAAPVRGRWLGFPAGLIAGVALVLSAAGAWWAWGPGVGPAEAAGAPRADDGASVAADQEQAQRLAAASRAALHAAAEAEERRSTAEDELADVQALAEVAEERVAALQRAAADARDAEGKAQKSLSAAQQAEAWRAGAERALTEAVTRLQAARIQQAELDRQLAATQGRLQATRGREDQARQAEAEAQRARQTADRQLADVRTRLQAAQAQAVTLDRAIEAKKAQLADLDRSAAVKRRPPAAVADTDAPASGAKPAGAFVREWLVIGPFADPDRKGHATAFPPETESVDLAKEYKGIGSLLRWRPHTSPTDYVDLAGLFRIHDPAVGYAVCSVRSDRPRSAQLSLGSNNGIKVWVNGKQVADRPVSRSAAPGQDRVPCEFAAGWNELRVKVDNTGGPWGFYLEVQEPGGRGPLTGLEFRATPPGTKDKK